MSSCASCGAPIKWAVTANGKRIPLDPEPHLDGRVRLIHLSNGREARVLTDPDLAEARHAGEALYQTHFATCPNADKHRKAA